MAKHSPWKQPWWRPTRGDELFFAWFILIHVGAVAGLVMFPLPAWTPAQLDTGWYTILLLERLGLAKNVRRPASTEPAALDAAA